MHSILGLGANHVLFAALISWFVAQALKIPIYHHVEHVWDFSRFFTGRAACPAPIRLW